MVVAGLLAVSAAAQAQTVTTLVSNTDSQHDGGSTGNVRAQSFETGFNTGGYTISEVHIRFGSAFGRTTLVKIRADAGGEPGDLVATLTNPGTLSSNRFNTFTAPPGTTLDASTTYWISVNEEVAAAQRVFISRTTSNAETGQTGWSIGDSHLLRTSETSSWGSDNHSLFIAIRGTPIVDPNDMTAPALDPNTPPSVDGPTLTLTYDEILDSTSTPAPGDFMVTVADAPRPVSSISVGTYTVTLTLSSVVFAGQSVAVSYAVPASNPVQDIAGNAAEALADHAVVNNTTSTVTSVAVTSVPVAAPDDYYGTGETIEITVTFSEPVTVDTTGGTPHLNLTIGSETRQAAYASTDSTGTALTFSYEVIATDHDQDGISMPADALVLNGGTIRNAAGHDAILDHSELSTQGSHKVNKVPVIITYGVQVTSTPRAAADTYGIGETIEITVTFSESVTVDTTGGTPRIEVRFGPPGNSRYAGYMRGSGGAALVFAYVVMAGDADSNGLNVRANMLELQGGTISGDGGGNADLSYASIGNQGDHKVDAGLTPPSTDATLNALALSYNDGGTDMGITLSPGFASDEFEYEASVANPVSRITVTETTSDGNATVEFLDGDDVELTDVGSADGFQVDLNPGDNVIQMKVTAEDDHHHEDLPGDGAPGRAADLRGSVVRDADGEEPRLGAWLREQRGGQSVHEHLRSHGGRVLS